MLDFSCCLIFFDGKCAFKSACWRKSPARPTCALIKYSSNFICLAPIYAQRWLLKKLVVIWHKIKRRLIDFHIWTIIDPIIKFRRGLISKCIYFHFEWRAFKSIMVFNHVVSLLELFISERDFILRCIALSIFSDKLNECLFNFWIGGVQEVRAMGWIRSCCCDCEDKAC